MHIGEYSPPDHQMEVSGNIHSQGALSHGENPSVTLTTKMGRFQSWSGHFAGKKNLLL